MNPLVVVFVIVVGVRGGVGLVECCLTDWFKPEIHEFTASMTMNQVGVNNEAVGHDSITGQNANEDRR